MRRPARNRDLPFCRLRAACLAACACALPAQEHAAVARARALLATGDAAAAAVELRAWLRAATGPTTAIHGAQLLLGRAALAIGQHGAAFDAFLAAAEDDALRGEARFGAARARAALGEPEDALAWLRRASDAGHRDRELALTVPELAALRDDPRFAAALPVALGGNALFVEPVRVLHDLSGASARARLGRRACALGDVDGDEVVDFAVSAAPASVIVYSAAAGTERYAVAGEDPAERFGEALAPVGDVDGDLVLDLAIGAPGWRSGTGRVLLVSGASGATLRELRGTSPGERFGAAVAHAGDLDGDGTPELAVAAPERGGRGAVLVFDGDGDRPRYEVTGRDDDVQFGSVLAAPRWRGLWLACATPAAVPRIDVFLLAADGAELVYRVGAARPIALPALAFTSDRDAGQLTGLLVAEHAAGRLLAREGATGAPVPALATERPGEGFGCSVAPAGDGDRGGPLLVGACRNEDGARAGGGCYVYSSAGVLLRKLTCRQPGERLGAVVAGLGDVDGDGAADFLVTAPGSSARALHGGRVLVIAGDR